MELLASLLRITTTTGRHWAERHCDKKPIHLYMCTYTTRCGSNFGLNRRNFTVHCIFWVIIVDFSSWLSLCPVTLHHGANAGMTILLLTDKCKWSSTGALLVVSPQCLRQIHVLDGSVGVDNLPVVCVSGLGFRG